MSFAQRVLRLIPRLSTLLMRLSFDDDDDDNLLGRPSVLCAFVGDIYLRRATIRELANTAAWDHQSRFLTDLEHCGFLRCTLFTDGYVDLFWTNGGQ